MSRHKVGVDGEGGDVLINLILNFTSSPHQKFLGRAFIYIYNINGGIDVVALPHWAGQIIRLGRGAGAAGSAVEIESRC